MDNLSYIVVIIVIHHNLLGVFITLIGLKLSKVTDWFKNLVAWGDSLSREPS